MSATIPARLFRVKHLVLGTQIRHVLSGLACLALIGCEAVPPAPTTTPQPRPAGLVPPKPKPTAPQAPSAASLDLARYYGRVQADLLNRGLLRVDGGGVDTPYTQRNLMTNFEQIAFYDEYSQAGGFQRSDGVAGGLRKWTKPVRMAVEFGASVPKAQRQSDAASVAKYAGRLARVTRHPITVSPGNANFFVLVMGEDDRDQLLTRIKQIEPGVDATTLSMIRNLPRSIHCVVAAFAAKDDGYVYNRAVAVIRAEHPELTRRACIHEELAQGLGLANDSPRARPSIFNDDDEFALLTTHDEELLRTLYDPALKPGMSLEEARPVVTRILAARLGPS
ncbi:MAG: DUF2927 domain-containing protein [Roseovarius sp.]